jgi:hypothetical protein
LDQEHGVRYFNELTNMAQLTESSSSDNAALLENNQRKESDKDKDLGEELADVVFCSFVLSQSNRY